MSKEKSIIIDYQRITQSAVNRFALQTTLTNTRPAYEYFIDGKWQADPPPKKPEKKRVVYDSLDSFRAARDIYFVWCELSTLSREKPVYPDQIIQRLGIARQTGRQITLFIPWGGRIQGDFGSNERAAMNRIDIITSLLRRRKIFPQVLIMPADVYATEINNINPELVNPYFGQVGLEAIKRGYLVKPWSTIRAENLSRYQEFSKELDDGIISGLLPAYILESALVASKRRSAFTDPGEQTRAAYAYLRERICEARIIDEVYNPIKTSMVSKNKDNVIDDPLPRIYILPEGLKFPWLK